MSVGGWPKLVCVGGSGYIRGPQRRGLSLLHSELEAGVCGGCVGLRGGAGEWTTWMSGGEWVSGVFVVR